MATETQAPQNPRQAILQLARQLFFEKGYSKVLMADLARQLGMSKKTLYLYFDGKEDLLKAVIKEYLAEGRQEIERILNDSNLNFEEKMAQYFSYVGSRLLAVSRQLMADIRKHAPGSWQLLYDYKVDAAFMRFNALLQEGMEKGYVRQDINRSLAVILYASALETIFNPDYTRQLPEQLTEAIPENASEVFDGLVRIIFEGVLHKK
ncbi:MAG: TetR/AcrR family transcriptional regulator [Hymenobacteraceae bacterium]|nr:TetR/AcrR family transcriptional regulator [Hymenobacteraceae bacterium]